MFECQCGKPNICIDLNECVMVAERVRLCLIEDGLLVKLILAIALLYAYQ